MTMNNNQYVIPDCCAEGISLSIPIEDRESLLPILNKSAQQIVDENPGILLFPSKLNVHEDGLDDKSNVLISYDERTECYRTSKLMGFVEYGGVQLKVRSRFDTDDRDFLLMYMLNRVFKINVFNSRVSSGESKALNILILLFPYALRKALRQGLYKEYFTNHNNDLRVKGVIDVNRHIRQNIPFSGKVAYRSREHTYDNNLTQLIRHTIEFIESTPLKGVFSQAKDEVSVIKRETSKYSKQARLTVIANNLRPVVHPYYSEYKGLQKLCLQILRHDKISYGSNPQKQLFGILFDGAWLWEEYLNTILKEYGYMHPTNKNKGGGIPMFIKSTNDNNVDNNKRQMFPDFYSPNYKQVMDAKYKPEKNIGRDDFYQVITYMHTMKYDVGGFIYPFQNCSNILKRFMLTGYGGYLCKVPFEVPYACDNYDEFKNKMAISEKKLIETLQNIINIP